jgi:hypothetical protein
MNLKKPFTKVLRSRWSVLKPNGSRVGISETGSEVTYSSSGWVTHTYGTNFKKIGLQSNIIDYTLTDKGRYVFYLESTIVDMKGEVRHGKESTEQTDIKVIHSSYDTAQASLTTPVSLGTLSNVCFDSYHRPWIINSAGVAHRLVFHHDVYLADYANNAIYFSENYDSVEVEA